jgi:hypothetical protein
VTLVSIQSQVSPIHTYYHPISLVSILILSYHLLQVLRVVSCL